MPKIHKHLYVSISVFSGTDPVIRIRAKISRIRNTGKTFKKCWLKLILYVLKAEYRRTRFVADNAEVYLLVAGITVLAVIDNE
jgi:hypothetical protein